MGWTSDLANGFAQLLADAGVGVWRPTGVYTTSETGITLRALPSSPDQAVALTVYPVRDDPAWANVTVGLQAHTRAGVDPRDVEDLADAVYDALHGAAGLIVGGVPVAQVYRQSSAQLGRDSTGRWERSDNYYVDATRPSTHRPD